MANGWTPEMLDATVAALQPRRPGSGLLGQLADAFRCPDCGKTRFVALTGGRMRGMGGEGGDVLHTGGQVEAFAPERHCACLRRALR